MLTGCVNVSRFALKFNEVGRRVAPRLYVKTKFTDPKVFKFASEVCPRYFGRALVLTEFIPLVLETFNRETKVRVAVLGGSVNEPEVIALENLGFKTEVKVFGIEKTSNYLDLNVISKSFIDYEFDLILCSQVWEHIWCHGNAFSNVYNLMGDGCFLWLAAPTSNRAHGSPDYFSAGFTDRYFVNNLENIGLSVLASGQLGTARNYRATHTMPIWPTSRSHTMPILYTFEGFGRISRLLSIARYFLRNLELLMFSSKITSDVMYATESWVFAKKDG
jgi:hypothetical protein